jgi:hypothetical protein
MTRRSSTRSTPRTSLGKYGPNSSPLLVAQPKQILAHDPDPPPKTNQDRILRAQKLMSFDPSCAEKPIYLRTDGQDMAGNPALRQQFELDSAVCQTEPGDDKDCMQSKDMSRCPRIRQRPSSVNSLRLLPKTGSTKPSPSCLRYDRQHRLKRSPARSRRNQSRLRSRQHPRKTD